jgi:hypothetical protein
MTVSPWRLGDIITDSFRAQILRLLGRGLHSSTFQLNLSRFGHPSPRPPV